MTAYLIPGVMGLLTGLLLHWARFSRQEGLRSALGLRRSLALRSGLSALGWGLMLTALLMWLAVIDVDEVAVLPLSLGALLGGALLGVCAALCGWTPSTAFAGLGAGNALEALCVLAGCFAGTWLLSPLDAAFAPLRTAPPYAAATLFRVTLDEPYLLAGDFLGLGCVGALLAAIGLCVPSPKPVLLTDEEVAARAAAAESADEAETASPEEPDREASPDPEAAPEETVVALLEGEEPLVIDTAMDEEAPEEDSPPEDDAEMAAPDEET